MDKGFEYEYKKNLLKENIEEKLMHHFGTTLDSATKYQIYDACASVIRDEIMEKWTKSQDIVQENKSKKLYYFSVEFLIGRLLGNNLINALEKDLYKETLKDIGINLNEIEEMEADAGLGNGGLGRLAACFLDSLTSLNLPVIGCGIRYEYGLFKQKIVDGYQIEMPDPWLQHGNVWEVYKPEEQEEVLFGGVLKEVWENGKLNIIHTDYRKVIAIPYDIPVTGYNTDLVNTLRLWSAHSPKYIDMEFFGRGDYIKASAEKELAEVISKVLYPEDNHYEGKELRLKQHYFFVSATLQSIIRNHKKEFNLNELPDKVAIHINDTHPALAIPELMRILIDNEGLDWDTAWDITTRTIAYTNHTVMEEALERWPVSIFERLLPRIYMILKEINERFCKKLWEYYPNEWRKISNMAIISYNEIKMANLCLATCYSINGVSALHTEILKNNVFRDFYYINTDKFHSITNGVTHRRWLMHANPELSELILNTIGDSWIKDTSELIKLEEYKDDPAFIESFAKVKQNNKERLAQYILRNNNIIVDPNSIFDVQVKRLHEYKRQLLNAFYILYLYNKLLKNPDEDIAPRTFIFGAKASPGYKIAKLIIKLINNIADKVNNDKRIKDKIKIVFLENYSVSLAEKIIPAANISKQISLAGKEASGTGNMKLMLNGALTVGTLDGANIEIYDAVGPDNIYIFGLKSSTVANMQKFRTYKPIDIYEHNYELKEVLDKLIDGSLDQEGQGLFKDIYNSLLYDNNGLADPYMLLMDFGAFVHIQEKVDKDYKNSHIWNSKSIINVARAGVFSSDRTIEEYNQKIWGLNKIKFKE